MPQNLHVERDWLAKYPTYGIWRNMLQRCRNPKLSCYPNYGGRGITVAKRWNCFANFLADMGSRPSAQHTLDRLDNNGPYSPENCQWNTRIRQGRNNRRNHILTINNESHCLSEWAELTGISAALILHRLRTGYSPEKLFAPAHRHLSKCERTEIVALKGIRTAREIAIQFGVSVSSIRRVWRSRGN